MSPFIMTSVLTLILLIVPAGAKLYKDGDKVDVYVNKVGPYANAFETYHYYTLPLCRPEKIVHKSLSLGQLLEGDRMAVSVYNILYKKNINNASLCGTYSLSKEDVKQLVAAVEEEFYFELIVDDLRLRNFIGYVEERDTFPHTHRAFLYNHYNFTFFYNDKVRQIIDADLNFIKNSVTDFTSFDPTQFQLYYTVNWISTEQEVRQSESDINFFNAYSIKVQWMSILNAALLVVLLIFFVTLILLSIVKRDLSNYNEASGDTDMIILENGWKTVAMDVFRKPENKSCFAAIIGVGTQFIFLIGIVLIIGSTNVVSVHRHGALNTIVVFLYAFTSGIAGFVSARVYRQLEGEKWISNVTLTTGLFNVPMFVVWAINNSVFWISGSTQALPFTTVLLLGLLWLSVGFPLTVIGGAVGKNITSRYSAPCRTRNVPRQLPSLPFYHSTVCFTLFGGFISFSAINVQLNFIFSTFWGRQTYTLCHIMLIIFFILVIVAATSSAALTYFQLNAEDYRWWWRSLFVGGGIGIFVFFYGLFFYYYRSEMSGLQQTVQYFSYLSLLSYVFFLSLGSVSFFASHWFVRTIYSSVKTD